jgi:hypothetical protein
MLKSLVRLSGTTTVAAYNKSVVTDSDLNYEDILEIAEAFERDSMSDKEAATNDESTAQMLMRWERYFKEKGGHNMSGFGYVEFSVEEKNEVVRCLLECKDHLNRSSGPSTANGFWQACAEAVTAQQCNMAYAATEAGKLAYAAAFENFRKMETTGKSSKTAAAARATKYVQERHQAATTAKATAEEQAAHVQAQVPVYVVLTDVREWIFLKLQGTDITYSAPHYMFDVNQGEIQALAGLTGGLQYLCYSIGISSVHSDIQNKLKAVAQCTTNDTTALMNAAFPPNIEEACGYVKMGLRYKSPADLKVEFEEEYPALDYDECLLRVNSKI